MAFSNAGLSWINHLVGAPVLTASSEVATMPVTNLIDDHRSSRWRSVGAGSAQINFDLGSIMPIGVVGLFGLNHRAAQWRIQLSATGIGNGDVLDTGTIDANIKPGYAQTVYCPPEPLNARYGRITLTDASDPPIQAHEAGTLWVGDLYRTQRNFSYGDAPMWTDPSVISRSRGGQVYVDVRDPFRAYELEFRGLTREEAYTVALEIDRVAGVRGNVLVVPTPGGPFQNYEAILGRPVIATPVPRWRHNLHRKRWVFEERL
ncbi:MAG TPA: discoidin domain-containing protein [Longimicrobiales bacterium]